MHSLTAGTIDLTLDGGDATVPLLSQTDVSPGASGQVSTTLKNAGTLDGYVDVGIPSSTEYENGCSGDETGVDSSCSDPGAGDGELGDHLELQATFANGPDIWSGWKLASTVASAGSTYDLDYELASGGTDDFVLDWRLPSDTTDEAESDSFEFTVRFHFDGATDSGV